MAKSMNRMTATSPMASKSIDDKYKGGKALVNSGVHHNKKHIVARSLSDDWKTDWTSPKHMKMIWETVDGVRIPLPQFVVLPNGQASILIDYNGNWNFSGGFNGNPHTDPVEFAIAFGLKSSLGHVIAFTEHGTVTGPGYTFNKQGHSPIVKDLWKEVVKGHDWYCSAIFKPHEKPHHNNSGSSGGGGSSSGGGSDVGAVVGDVATVLGTILAFF
jgi:hypothetical protein